MSTSRETFQCCWNPVSSVSSWTLVAILVLLLTKAYPKESCLTSLSFCFLVYANNNYLIVLLKGLEGMFTEIWSTLTGAITVAIVVRMWLERAVTSRQWLDLNPVPRQLRATQEDIQEESSEKPALYQWMELSKWRQGGWRKERLGHNPWNE